MACPPVRSCGGVEQRERCRSHGGWALPEHLVGRRLVQVVASWHHGTGAPSGPVDAWLIDSGARCGRIEVAPINDETPFAGHLGGRLALELVFGSGTVRCESWSGDLRLSSS
jgi:hypothetical protein